MQMIVIFRTKMMKKIDEILNFAIKKNYMILLDRCDKIIQPNVIFHHIFRREKMTEKITTHMRIISQFNRSIDHLFHIFRLYKEFLCANLIVP